eukprot:4353495-Ditylum_brightwellii.AAC.1
MQAPGTTNGMVWALYLGTEHDIALGIRHDMMLGIRTGKVLGRMAWCLTHSCKAWHGVEHREGYNHQGEMQALGTTNITALGFVAGHKPWHGARHRMHGMVLGMQLQKHGIVMSTEKGITTKEYPHYKQTSQG